MASRSSSDTPLRRERIIHVASDHQEAAAWDCEQHARMTPAERHEAARMLRARVYPANAPDVRAFRECVRWFRERS